MPGRVSLKLVCLLAAVAFVAGFRLHAGGDDQASGTSASAVTLSPARASALRADAAPTPTASPVHARLAAAPGLPVLHRAPRAHTTHHSAPRPAAAAPVVTAAPTPAPTVAPVVTAAPRVVVPAAPRHTYVGQGFDSQG